MFSQKIIILSLLTFCYLVRAEEENTKDVKEQEDEKLKYSRPTHGEFAYFAEPFHSLEEFEERWIYSAAKKDGVDESIAKYDGKWSINEPKDNPIVGDNGLIFMSEAKHGAISSPLKNPFKFEDKPLVVQYEVRFQKKHECGGAYVKLIADAPEIKYDEFGDKTEYTIMFGPDKCGGDDKLHFIFQHKNPITHKMEEKHAKKPSGEFNNIFDDGKTHLVGLIVRPDNTFEIQVDKVVVNEGNLLKDMEPSINPPKMIDDPEDLKPEHWDEREKITDPTATKPDDWDEDAPTMIADPSAKKPEGWLDDEPELAADPAAVKPKDWDEEEDGEWEAPQIANPKCKAVGCGEWKAADIKNPAYKGKWSSPLITNPDYKGVWKAKQIENPNFFEDNNPFRMKPIAAVGFELWSMQSEILFDNMIIADDLSIVNQWTEQTWDLKYSKEVKSGGGASGMWQSFKETTQEKPWLWIIVALIAILPIVMIYFLCCTGKGDKAAVHKKTDDVVPDDDSVEDEATDNVSDGAEESKAPEDEGKTTSENDDSATPNIEEVTDPCDTEKDEIEHVEIPTEEEKGDTAAAEVKEEVPVADDSEKHTDVAAPIENIATTDVQDISAKDTHEHISTTENVAVNGVSADDERDSPEEEETPISNASPKTRCQKLAAKKKIRKEP